MLPPQSVATKLSIVNSAHSFRQRASPQLPPRLPRWALDVPRVQKPRQGPGCKAVSFSEHLADVGAGGGGNHHKNRPTTEDSGGNFFEHNALIDVLVKVRSLYLPTVRNEVGVKGGVALSELPRDLQEALSLGLLSMKDVHLWINISSIPLLGSICRAAPAVRDRVMGNPRFIMQLCVELALGLSAKTVAEMKARGDKCFKEELPFFLSDLALEAIADCALVWLLSPKRSFKALPTNRIARGIARLPGHSLQGGAFSMSQRMMTVLYRSCQFFAVGVITSALGHSVTKWAVERKAGSKEDVHLAPVLDNSLGFGAFMALSSNIRYQTVNGLEERLLDVFLPSATLNTLATFLLRFTNCYCGGVQWVWFAKSVGLQ